MTASDRIQQLCQQALANPDISATERAPGRGFESASESPADPSSDGHAADELVRISVPAGTAPRERKELPGGSGEAKAFVPAADAAADEEETLRAMLDQRDRKRGAKRRLTSWGITAVAVLLAVGAVLTVALRPELRERAVTLAGHLRQGGEDLGKLGNLEGEYDEALEEVSQRSDQIDAATRALGVDPAVVDSGEDPGMTRELGELAGGEEADRMAARGGKLGKIGSLARKAVNADSSGRDSRSN